MPRHPNFWIADKDPYKVGLDDHPLVVRISPLDRFALGRDYYYRMFRVPFRDRLTWFSKMPEGWTLKERISCAFNINHGRSKWRNLFYVYYECDRCDKRWCEADTLSLGQYLGPKQERRDIEWLTGEMDLSKTIVK